MKFSKRLRSWFSVVRDFFLAIAQHDLLMNAAATAFFLFLSLPPALLTLVSLVGMVPIERWSAATTEQLLDWVAATMGWLLPEQSAEGIGLGLRLRFQPLLSGMEDLSTERVMEYARLWIGQALPEDVAGSLCSLLEDILDNPRSGLLTVSFVTILWSAGGATRSAMCSLGTIYEVKVRAWFSRSVISLGLTLAYILCWSLCLVLIPISNAIAQMAVTYFGWDQGVLLIWGFVDWILAGLLVFTSILCLNRFGPDVPLRMQALIPGSLLTLGLWIAMTMGLGMWMEYSWANYNTTYGALSVVIVLLLWCYLLSIGLLLGAELNTAILRLRQGGLEAAGKGDLHEAIRDAVEEQIEAIPILEESARKRSL